MSIRYYVLRSGDGYRVLREAKPKGWHQSKGAALTSAMFMASIEAAKQRTSVEVFAEDDHGRLLPERTIGPDDQVGMSCTGKQAVFE